MDRSIPEEVIESLLRMPEASGSPSGNLEPYYAPTERLLRHFNFANMSRSYEEARQFLNYLLAKLPGPPEKMLDFGCGWGRMLRLLRKSGVLDETEVFGCDIDDEGLRFVERTVPRVAVSIHAGSPPTAYVNGEFDLIYAYSVFSHLPPKPHMAWAGELRRICKVGGTVCVTTQGMNFLKWCLANPDLHLPKLISDVVSSDAVSKYEAGEYLYALDSPLRPDYGHAVVPRSYFEKNWRPLGFEIVDWDGSGSQDRCLLRAV